AVHGATKGGSEPRMGWRAVNRAEASDSRAAAAKLLARKGMETVRGWSARKSRWERWLCYFFFSSRRRHTRSKRDWSSDVCSSDLKALKSNEADLSEQGRVFLNPDDPNAFVLPDLISEFTEIDLDPNLPDDGKDKKIGRASCRERVEI